MPLLLRSFPTMPPMRRSLPLYAALVCAAVSACAHAPRDGDGGGTLRSFRDDAELVRFHQALVRRWEVRMEEAPPPPPPPPAPPPSAPAGAQGVPAGGGESVTNVQHAGVDEGGIVKVHGDHLVVLRRGRLFTVRIGGGALEPVAAVDAFGPGIDPARSWYDEMLVAGDLVAVIGYSYDRGGSEVGLFRIDAAGGLTHRATYQLRSSDYYSSRNYASRLVAGKLVFYAPIEVDPHGGDPRSAFPAVRRWGGADTAFHRTADATRVYRPAGPVSIDDDLVLHTVTVCDPDDERLRCRSTALFGPEGRVFYVSPEAVYVWATQYPAWDAAADARERSVLYRMPLDGSAPTGLRVSGSPVDKLSFLESADRHLNVLVRATGRGEGMWGAEMGGGEVALLRVPLGSFGNGSRMAPAEAYRALPHPGPGAFQNRFVGDWLLYGVGGGWGAPREGGSSAYATRWAGAGVDTLRLPHALDRIEAMGSGAVLVGAAGRDLHFSGVRLGERARPAHRYVRADAAQGETRTHGFFYRPDGEERGVLGLPVRGPARPGYEHLRRGSAAVLFLRNEGFRLHELGELAASPEEGADDGCRASCVDWYGNARPLFLRGRVFALLGYEIVEGAEEAGRIREVRRVGFAPRGGR